MLDEFMRAPSATRLVGSSPTPRARHARPVLTSWRGRLALTPTCDTTGTIPRRDCSEIANVPCRVTQADAGHAGHTRHTLVIPWRVRADRAAQVLISTDWLRYSTQGPPESLRGLADHVWRVRDLLEYRLVPVALVEPRRRGRPRTRLLPDPIRPKRPPGRPRIRPLPDVSVL
jgi:hypothetical protein